MKGMGNSWMILACELDSTVCVGFALSNFDSARMKTEFCACFWSDLLSLLLGASCQTYYGLTFKMMVFC